MQENSPPDGIKLECKREHVEIDRVVNRMFIDFNLLASQYPKLYPHLVILGFRTTINFRNQQSLIVLTQAILQIIFNIRFISTHSNLCPRIPSRINYLIWISHFVPIDINTVMDVGTGATAIYPLLGWSVFKWRFIATQANAQSVENANKLVKLNKLEKEIKVIWKNKKDEILKIDIDNHNLEQFKSIDVVMCNPPFYQSQTQQQQLQYGQQVPRTEKKPIGTMLMSEFQTEGGQYNFFFQLYRQSFHYVDKMKQDCISTQNLGISTLKMKYFTCLLGRQTTFNEVKRFLLYEMSQNMLEMYKLGEIRQGSNARFIIMWRPKHL